nr:putative reverse transcriptase domain-containing protein [Tanacetum cinerariifolium]
MSFLGIGGRTGRGGSRTRGRSGDQGNGRIDGQSGQVGGQGNQGSNQRNPKNQNSDAINDNIQGDVRSVIVNKNQRGCTYKEFLACNPKEYDGKGDEAVRNGSLKKNPEKRENDGEHNRDRNVRDENKRTRIGNAFATTTNRVEPSTKARGNRPIQVVSNNRVQGRKNNGNQAHGRVFMLGAEEARQDPNIVTGTFTLKDHYATTNYGSDYSFISTTFIPLLCIEPSELGFSYETEIASGQLVLIDKVIRGCKLEI